jgi:short-subunit dehydrogenase
MRIEGSTILLTGASSGIGEALAPMLAARGAVVGIAARRADRLAATLDRCQSHTAASRMWVVDLADARAADQLARDAWSAFGALDCVVNNAGVGKRKLVQDHTPDDIDTVMCTNFVSPVRINLTVLPLMLERGSGTIVNIASGGGRFGIAHESVYCASKFALSGWSEVAAMDLADTPIEVKLIQPGAIATEIWYQQPGELPGLQGAEFVTAEACATGIVEAMETDGFEFFVPAELKQHVDFKNGDVDSWIGLMAGIGRATAP